MALDIALALGRITNEELVAGAHCLRAVPGARRAQAAAALADGRAESPQESRLRVTLVLGGLTPEPQYELFDGTGRFIARVDQAFVAQRMPSSRKGPGIGSRASCVATGSDSIASQVRAAGSST